MFWGLMPLPCTEIRGQSFTPAAGAVQGHLARFGSQVNVSQNHVTPTGEQMLQVVPVVPVKVPNHNQTFPPSLCHISPEFLIHMLLGMHKANASPRRPNEEYPSNYITSLPSDSISQMQKEHLRRVCPASSSP